MSKTFKAVWLGDDDPQSQIIRMGDLRFIKGEAESVPADHEFADRIKENPMFAIDNEKAEVVNAREPTADEQQERAEEGTEKGALKAQLRALGVNVAGNPNVDTLRNKLADATK